MLFAVLKVIWSTFTVTLLYLAVFIQLVAPTGPWIPFLLVSALFWAMTGASLFLLPYAVFLVLALIDWLGYVIADQYHRAEMRQFYRRF